VPGVEPPEPTRLGEVVWLEPYPDALLEGAIDVPVGPEARYEQSESISLAFVTALQVLPPRQVAVLILRDVLGFHASEVAEMLGSGVAAVNGTLRRARAGLERRLPSASERPPAPPSHSPAEDAMVAKFVRAYESADIDALVFGSGLRFGLVPAHANGQPAVGAYVRAPDGTSHAAGRFVLTLTGNRICAMTRFENTVLASFGLPRSLPGR